jgi:hypothetical protein
MMMPSGSSDRFVSVIFVILDTSVMRFYNAQQGPSGRAARVDRQVVLLQCFSDTSSFQRLRGQPGQSIRIDTQMENARVKLTQAFEIWHRA